VRAATSTEVDLTRGEFDAVRRLLEDQKTWTVAGQGTVEDLAGRIASCLPVGKDRTAEDSRSAAMTIARGLIEFAVSDLDPKIFNLVLLARLQRLETNQGSALDIALLDLHADLIARFIDIEVLLDRVLDRLPPGPACRLEAVRYLKTLISGLDEDRWPEDRQLHGPALTPAAIERKLRITATGVRGEQDFDADILARQCQRLVILAGPGSGKTWLARRTARRCAEEALEALLACATARKEFTLRAGLAAVAEYERAHGAFTPAELADADQWTATALGHTSPPARKTA
jgi:hypothetical protein